MSEVVTRAVTEPGSVVAGPPEAAVGPAVGDEEFVVPVVVAEWWWESPQFVRPSFRHRHHHQFQPTSLCRPD